MKSVKLFTWCIVATLVLVGPSWADPIPQLSSDRGAPYTIYLDFGGFNFPGNWGNNSSYVPGNIPAYTGSTLDMEKIWSRVAEKYAPFNINVTTIDPAPKNLTDKQRTAFYDNHANLMHTVIGGTGFEKGGGGGGISYVGTTPGTQTGTNGYHTNFVFAGQAPSFLQFIGEGASHENGHGLGLDHQTDYNGKKVVNEYSNGNGKNVAPVMGVSYYTERGGAWAIGTTHPGIQNDDKIIVNDPGMGGYFNDHIGHSLATATVLPLLGTDIDFTRAHGVIVPSSVSNPLALGSNNYRADYWTFTVGGDTVLDITAVDGRSTITPGVADPGATLGSYLELRDASGALIFRSDYSYISENISMTVGAGKYYLDVISGGGQSDKAYAERDFFEQGSFFLKGSLSQPVPEPASLTLLGLGTTCLGVYGWRRRKCA